MTNLPKVVETDFHGDTIHSVQVDGETFIPIRRIVENIGLDWTTQAKRLNDDPKFSCRHIPTTGSDGKTYKMLCLNERDCHAWLNSVNSNKVREDLRDKLIQYQRESMEVVARYWRGETVGRGTKPDKIHLREIARTYRALAGDKNLSTENRTECRVRALETLTGESHDHLRPKPKPNTSMWMSATELAKEFNVVSSVIGKVLKKLGLHGDQDAFRQWSEPVLTRAMKTDREFYTFIYDPDVVLDPLEEELTKRATLKVVKKEDQDAESSRNVLIGTE